MNKKETIKEFQRHKEDTGSDEVQAAITSHRIERLQEHLRENPKDLHSKRGLLSLVARRRHIIKNLRRKSEERYHQLIKALGLKR